MAYNDSGEYSAIYNQLLFGKKLTLQFPDTKHANSFRSAIQLHHKRTQDKYQSLGIDMGTKGRISLVRLEGNQYELKFTEAPKSSTQFAIISISENS